MCLFRHQNLECIADFHFSTINFAKVLLSRVVQKTTATAPTEQLGMIPFPEQCFQASHTGKETRGIQNTTFQSTTKCARYPQGLVRHRRVDRWDRGQSEGNGCVERCVAYCGDPAGTRDKISFVIPADKEVDVVENTRTCVACESRALRGREHGWSANMKRQAKAGCEYWPPWCLDSRSRSWLWWWLTLL